MNKKIKIFIIEIEIEQDSYPYTTGQRIMIPVKTSTAYHAILKFENKCWGSEYPSYKIIGICKCDDFLFKPLGFSN
ncbi:hypothetical protein [Riemerella anatipestifer]|uniref:hypothetical protein n=1 Tax=Riemerella anatipestifer TaxID=34085 RepID=UPI0023640131|nr:hypothetical protein [Riemerella anatipestifer]MDD1525572.1 hypothetical protein [Riemerella anatipestifer]